MSSRIRNPSMDSNAVDEVEKKPLMTSNEDPHSRLLEPATSDRIKNSEPRNRIPPTTTITFASDSLLPTSPISPLKESDESINESVHHHVPNRKRIFSKRLSMATISHQFTIRKILQNRLGYISDIMCFLGIFGIVLMVIENEITFRHLSNREMNISWFIKLIITISTVVLVSLVLVYHHFNSKLYAAQNSLNHWHVGLTTKRIFPILLEIIICSIHPIPRYFPQNWLSKHEETKLSPYYISTDVALSLPMFARLYLLCRCIMFHSYLVRNTSSKSLGSFNQVSINLTFLMKTYLEQWPARCLIISCCLIFFIGSWSLRACDYKPTVVEHISMFNAMWLFIITFTTVGYGDLTPSTYCGRTVAAMTALFGLVSSALLISVITQKLQLTRWEKYVHNFVSDMELSRGRREQAANVIKFAMKVWYLKRRSSCRSYQCLRAERFLYRSIYSFRKIKHEQRKLNNNSLDLVELIQIQRYTSIKTQRIVRDITTMKLTMEQMEEKFVEMNKTMNHIQQTLNLSLEKYIN